MSIGWYRTGTISVTSGSNEITGDATYWLSAGLNKGDILFIDGNLYELHTITDNTHLTIAGTYSGTTGSGKSYAIIRNFTSTMQSGIAKDLTNLMSVYEQIRDGVYLTIQGKSAYQIACDKGYVGTESQWLESLKGPSAYAVAVANGYNGTLEQWLESLKAAGEWQSADTRITDLETTDSELITKTGYIHRNNIYRGKDLGAFTDDWYAEITSGRFTDMYIGDYFTIDPSHKYYIAAFDWCWYNLRREHIVLFPMQGITEAEADPYPNTRSLYSDIGTEGEEGYIPAANGEYAETNWYVNLRPKFIAQMAEFFGGESRLKQFAISVPSSTKANGQVTAIVDLSSKAHLPTMGMINGHQFLAQRAGDDGNNTLVWTYRGLYMYPQLPLFRSMTKDINAMHAESTRWLDGYNESSTYSLGDILSCKDHSNWKNRVKPIFCIG